MMRIVLLWLLLPLLASNTYSQPCVSAEWGAGILGNESFLESGDICTDAIGNLYRVGGFSRDSFIIDGHLYTRNGWGMNMYVLKLSPFRQLLWAKTFWSQQGEEEFTGIAIDKSGRIFLSGRLYNVPSISFDSITITTSANGAWESVVIEIDPAGNVLNGVQIPGIVRDLAFDSQHGYLAGEFNNPVTLGSDTLRAANPFEPNFYVAKFDSNFNFLWATSPDLSTSIITPTSIAVDAFGNVYGTGYFFETLILGSTTLNNISTSGDRNAFTFACDAVGNFKWVRSGASTYRSAGEDVVTDSSGNIYVTGFFNPDIRFGNQTINTTRPQFNWSDFFIVKYDSSGTLIWVINQSGGGADLHIDNDHLWMAGSSSSASSPALVGNDIIKMDFNGNIIWEKNFVERSPRFMAFIDSTQLYLCGNLYHDTILIGNDSLISADGFDIWVAKFSMYPMPGEPLIIPPSQTICNNQIAPFYVTPYNSDAQYEWQSILLNGGDPFIPSYPLYINFTGAPEYMMTLKVREIRNGCTGPFSRPASIQIFSVPQVRIDGSDIVCAGDTALFTYFYNANISNPITLYLWETQQGIILDSGGIAAIHYPAATSDMLIFYAFNDCGFGSDTFPISILAPPLLNISTADTTICQGDSVQLIANGTGDFSWNPPVVLSDPLTSDPVVYPFTSATFVVTLTDEFGCKASDSVNIYVDICNGINSVSAPAQIHIFPNPATGSFQLKINQEVITGYTVNLENINGTVCHTAEFKGNEPATIDYDEPGVYLLKAHSANWVLIRKVIIL